MSSRANEMAYSESIEAYPDASDFQYLEKSVREALPISRPNNDDDREQAFETSHLQPTPGPPHTFFSVLGSWIWELISCVLALGSLAGIIVVLQQFNGRALRDWPYSITINTLLSILITVIKAAVIVPLAEGISQLKWSWYKQRDQALEIVVTFDEASRGAFGAFKLLFSISPFHLASIGSVLFLASFTVGPFAQQVVQIRQRDIRTNGLASIPTCGGRYNDINPGPSMGAAPGVVDIGLDTIGAIYDGILQNGSSTPIETACPTGNCTFSPYQSLGFCSRCADITRELVPYHPSTGEVISVEDCPEETGCKYYLRIEEQSSLLSWLSKGTSLNTTAYNRELFAPDLVNITGLVNVTAIYGETDSRWSNPLKIAAFECALYFCVLQYSGNVTEGLFNETSTEIPSKLEYEGNHPWSLTNVTIVPEFCFGGGIAKAPPYSDDENCTYSLYGMNGLGLNQAIAGLFTGFATLSTSGRPLWSSHIMQKLGEQAGNKIDTIDTVFKSLAKRLTTHARTAPDTCSDTSGANGTVWATEAFISVRWFWLILPAVVVCATFLLLVVIIIKTCDEYIWKSSPLSLVFLGMQDSRQSDGVTHPIFPRNPELKSMVDSSKGIKMRLDGSGRWTIIGNQ